MNGSRLLNPPYLAIIALFSAVVFALFAIEALRSQYFEHHGEDKSYFIDTRHFPIFRLDDQTLRIVVKSNKLYSLTERGEFTFGVHKYKSANISDAPDGAIVQIYADDALIAQEALNPYADKSFPYIEDGFTKNLEIKFAIPKGTQTLAIEFLPNENSALDVIAPIKLKAHRANALGCAAALIALLAFIASFIALACVVIRRYSNPAFTRKIYDYFYSEKCALFIYRLAVASLILSVAYFIMISADFTINLEGRFHLPMSLNDFFLYHEPRYDGRFFPLANTDYNLLRFLPYGYSAQGFYFINLVTFIVTICAIIHLLKQSDRDKIASRYINAFFLILILLAFNRSIKVFMEIIYPERLLSATVVIFMLLLKKALDGDKIVWFATAALTALYATYQKEIMFGVFIVLALFMLLLAPKTKNRIIFSAVLIVNGAVFLLVYYWTTLSVSTHVYASNRRVEIYDYAVFFAKNWLFIILFVFFVVRGWFVAVKRDRARTFYDATLFASCAFVCAYLVLAKADWGKAIDLPRAYYYYAPAALMFIPSLIYWSKYLYFNKRYALFWTIAIVLLLSCRIFSLDEEIEARRNNRDFVAALNAYTKLGKRAILIEDGGIHDWQLSHLLGYAKYLNSKAHMLTDETQNVNIELRPSSDPIDYNAVYIVLGADINASFVGFKPILRAKAYGTGPFTAYVYDQ
ncbi:MAG: hypothetical protein LBI57_03485 [Helicobacteraceae bacterium]|jgi:hypothetical protein|nr:hypothetical protein [Helicobacteraceae bacterium]